MINLCRVQNTAPDLMSHITKVQLKTYGACQKTAAYFSSKKSMQLSFDMLHMSSVPYVFRSVSVEKSKRSQSPEISRKISTGPNENLDEMIGHFDRTQGKKINVLENTEQHTRHI